MNTKLPAALRDKKTAIITLAVAGVVILFVVLAVINRNNDDTGPSDGGGTTASVGEEAPTTPRDPGRVTELPLAPPPAYDAPPTTSGISRAEVALPEGFPVPPGTTFLESAKDGDRNVTLFTVTSPADALEFFKKELPANKFYVSQARQDPTGNTSAEFTFFARGSDTPIVLTIEGQTAQLVWQDKPAPPPAEPAPAPPGE